MEDRVEDLLSSTGEGEKMERKLLSLMQESGLYSTVVFELEKIASRLGDTKDPFSLFADLQKWSTEYIKKNMAPSVQVEIFEEIGGFIRKYAEPK